MNVEHIHFIGIGGIGISAIARMMHLRGKKVTGSDMSASVVTNELEKYGIKVFIGQTLESVPRDADLIVYSAALEHFDEIFLQNIKQLGIRTMSYPEMLGTISADYYTIAIAGTHGKTTTTAMVGKILRDAGLDPTMVVGSLLKEERTNFIAGKSKYLVVEADEYRRAFLNLTPSILVITNIDADHLDYYKDMSDITSAFISLVKKIPKDGALICNSQASNMAEVIHAAQSAIVDFSSSDTAVALRVHGNHNIRNAQAALAVAKVLGIDEAVARKSLSEFSGIWRRFEYKGVTAKGALVYDEYAHNPQKVKAALEGAKKAHPDKKIIAVFQPHLFSRTKSLLKEFSESFDDAHEIVLVPIYGAREQLDPTITSDMLLEKLIENKRSVVLFPDILSAYTTITGKYGDDAVIMTIGAGDITSLSDKLTQK